MGKQTFTAGQVLTAAEMNSLQENDYNWAVSTKTASYVLAAGDEGTRIVMDNAGATTITVDDAIFAAGDVVWVHNIGAGTCTITAGTATVNTTGGLGLALGQYAGGQLYFASASAALFFPNEAGGTIPFADAAARTTAVPSPIEGQMSYLKDTDSVEVYDGSAWAAVGGGKILQVVSTLKTDTFTTTSSTFTTVTGLTASITPSSATSKILILAQINMSLTTYSVYARLSGGNTSTYLGDAAGNRVQSVIAIQSDNDNPFWRTQFSVPLTYLDSPATTSSVTYGVDVRIGTGAVYVNRSQDDSNTVNNGRTASTITVMEVSA